MATQVETFQRRFHGLQTPLCLCDGLEIIATNAAFDTLMLQLPKSPSPILLSHLIGDQTKIDRLMTGKAGIELKITSQASEAHSQNLTARTADWIGDKGLRLIEWTDVTGIRSLEVRLADAKNHDHISGALLSDAFDRALKKRLRNQQAGVLIYVDYLLEQYPEMDFDRTAASLADQMREEFGDDALVGRLQTHRLAIHITTEDNEEDQRHTLMQIARLARNRRFSSANSPCRISAVSVSKFDTGLSNLHVAATLAMKKAKPAEPPVWFDPEMLEQRDRLHRLAKEMPDAIEANEITPHFQPIIEAASGQLKGFEALVRWIHPDLGYVIPPDIVAIAQKHGHLERLTAHVIQCAIDQMACWPTHIQFSVNVTPSQLTESLVDLVRHKVRENNVDPGRLEIEVTEDALIENFEFSSTIFARLRAIGVAMAMDDFGAGYTSIGNLRQLKFSKIKIDKIISDGLPHDPRSLAIVRSLMVMARELAVDITVEGIETKDQLAFLRAFNCGVQGYVFSPPVAVDKLDDLRKFLDPVSEEQYENRIVGIGPRKTKAENPTKRVAR